MDRNLQARIDEFVAPWSGFSGLFERLSCRILRLRTEREWQQADLAEALGIHRVTLASYERGEKVPPLRVLVGLACLFELDLETLVYGPRGAAGARRDPRRVAPARALSLVRFDP